MGDTNRAYEKEGQVERQKEVTVLVTGYGPFLDKFPVNSSWSIASSLPSSLPSTPEHPISIRIVTIEEPIKVCYDHVAKTVPKLLEEEKYDIVLHIGLAARRNFFTLERQSYREPYWKEKDVDGETFSKKQTEDLWPGFPDQLKPTFDCEDVWRRWRSNMSSTFPNADIRPSVDPGNFLCGFIYYLSMAWFLKKEAKERPVMFLHVPDCPRPKDVEKGRDVAIGLIRALVESRDKVGTYDPMKADAPSNIDHVMGGAEMQAPIKERWSGK